MHTLMQLVVLKLLGALFENGCVCIVCAGRGGGRGKLTSSSAYRKRGVVHNSVQIETQLTKPSVCLPASNLGPCTC